MTLGPHPAHPPLFFSNLRRDNPARRPLVSEGELLRARRVRLPTVGNARPPEQLHRARAPPTYHQRYADADGGTAAEQRDDDAGDGAGRDGGMRHARESEEEL